MTQLAPLFHHASAGKVRDIKALSRTGPTGVACMMAVQAFQVQLEVERWTSNSDVTAWPFRSSSDQHISSTYPCLWWCGPLHSSTSTTSCGLYRIHRNLSRRAKDFTRLNVPPADNPSWMNETSTIYISSSSILSRSFTKMSSCLPSFSDNIRFPTWGAVSDFTGGLSGRSMYCIVKEEVLEKLVCF